MQALIHAGRQHDALLTLCRWAQASRSPLAAAFIQASGLQDCAALSSRSSGAARAFHGSAAVAVDCFSTAGPLPPAHRRVVVTGLGLVTPLGVGVEATWSGLLAGRCGIRQLQAEDLPQAHRPHLEQLACSIAGLIPRQQLAEALAPLQEDARRQSRFIQLALLAGEEALSDAGWHPASLSEAQRAATGVSVGSGMSCTEEVAEAGALAASGKGRRISPFFVPRILPNMAAGALSIRHGLRGPNHCASTACAAGAHAIGDAFRLVQRGDADVMVAGAAESCVDGISLSGFGRLKALSTKYNDQPGRASRPFDVGRDGFVMGEGGGMLVLEELEHARARGARIYAEVRGYGASGDGHHITHPHPQGEGARLAMERALARSGVDPSDVVYLNAHATSTPAGDEIEQAAVLSVFGAEAVKCLAVSSTKGATGHLLGAAGAAEAVITVLALHHRMAPPTLNLEYPDPHLLPGLIGPPPPPPSQASHVPGVVPGPAPLPPSPQPIAVMSNSFGFGGTNACLLFASPPAL